jgi:hypothetical protein
VLSHFVAKKKSKVEVKVKMALFIKKNFLFTKCAVSGARKTKKSISICSFKKTKLAGKDALNSFSIVFDFFKFNITANMLITMKPQPLRFGKRYNESFKASFSNSFRLILF